jgi:D-beta-D-heptose 7-phosphate kinase/D-beta-D-heptose 1-phosphate adenosyltransferase
MAALDVLLDQLIGRCVLIAGDLMLDQFVFGTVHRISPEAPVPVVQFVREEYRLGGAANVATNVVALKGRAQAVGIVGSDPDGARLVSELSRLDVDTTGVIEDPSRCTTRKLRVVTTRNQQVARIDYESDAEVSRQLETTTIANIERLAQSADAILISDYLKGFVSRRIVRRCIEAASARRVPVLVDPKVPHIDYYQGASVITPNHHEAEAITHMRIRSRDDARAAAQRIRAQARCESVLITRGEHGMTLVGPNADVELPAEAREVADVTGAGDTVIGALALGLAAGGSLVDAAELANRAAGIVVGKFGPATVTVDELRAVKGARC